MTNRKRNPDRVDLGAYDRILCAFSGGKDSIACILHLIDMGVDMRKLEIHHHSIDGREGDDLMDWPITPDYCRKWAKAFGLKFYDSWREDGFRRHMLRKDQPPAPIHWNNPDGTTTVKDPLGKTRSKPCGVCGELCHGCIGKFPQVTADLKLRWCSAACKIEIMERMINNAPRFREGRTLVITGERAEESASRAKYETFEPHRSDNRDGKLVKRYVDHWRPVHGWSEERVWSTIERYNIRMHPAYRLGWSRLSCISCIFGSDAQWASVKAIDPKRFKMISDYEKEFGCSIHRTKYLTERVQNARPYLDMSPGVVAAALSATYDEPIFEEAKWTLPNGAYGENHGPS